MIRICLNGLIFVFLAGCKGKSAAEYFADAEKLEEKEKYREAIQLLDKAISKNPEFLDAYINRGADKSSLGDYQGAISDYEKVIAKDPQNTLALVNIANNYKRLDEYKAAVVYYDKALKTKGGGPIYFDLQPNDFIDEYKFDVPVHEIFFERGIALYELDSLKKSYNDFEFSISKNYMVADCYYWIGMIYFAAGQKQLGCESLNKSKSLGDKDAEKEIKKYCYE